MFAECCVFAKQSDGPFHCARDKSRDPFSRSYGANLPSSLTGFHSCALVYSTYPPVSVYGTGAYFYTLELFLALVSKNRIVRRLTATNSSVVISPLMRPSSLNYRPSRNINRVSIAYAHRPRLRSRLTPGRKTLPGKPWIYGGAGFHCSYRYSCLHSHFSALQGQSPSPFTAQRMLLYRALVN